MVYRLQDGLRSAIMSRLSYVPEKLGTEYYNERLMFRNLDQLLRWEDIEVNANFRLDLRKAMYLPPSLYHHLPTVQIKLKPSDVMADLTGRDALEFVSERFRDLIETVAPAAVQFIPAQIVDAKVQPVTRFGPRYFMNILSYVSPIDLFEGTNVVPEVERAEHADVYSYGPYNIPSPKHGQLNFTVSRAAVLEHQIFRSFSAERTTDGVRELHSAPNYVFVSNQLAHLIKKSKIKNVMLERCAEV